MSEARPIRVLYVLNTYGLGGAENGLLRVIDGGFFIGWDVQVVALFEGDSRLSAELSTRGVKWSVLVPRAQMSLRGMILAGFRLIRLFRSSSPDCAILSLEQANILGRIAAAVTHRTSVVSFEHSTRYSRWWYTPLLWVTFPLVSCVFYDSEATHDARRKALKRWRRPWLHVPLVSVSARSAQYARKRRERGLVILCVGRLVPVKNVANIIRSLVNLSERGLRSSLWVVGDGVERGRLQQLACDLGLVDRVRFFGYLEDWTRLCVEASVFVHASRREGLCISVIEAMSMGMPVCATDVGEIQRYGIHRRNMMKLRNGSPDAIAGAVQEVWCNRALRESIGKRAKMDAERLFGTSVCKTSWAAARAAVSEYGDRRASDG